jgi:hypothetical protein
METLFAGRAAGFPTGLGKSIEIGDQAALPAPNVIIQSKAEISVFSDVRQPGTAIIFVGEQPELVRMNTPALP